MLKLFYKTLLVSFLSMSLLLLNFQFNGLIFEVDWNSAKAVTTVDTNTGTTVDTTTVGTGTTINPVGATAPGATLPSTDTTAVGTTILPTDTTTIGTTAPLTDTTTVGTNATSADATTPTTTGTPTTPTTLTPATPPPTTPATTKPASATSAPTANNANANTKEKLKTDAITDSGMIATLTMIAVAVVVIRLFKCKWTTDMMIAIAGGVIYLAGEVLAAFKLKAVMKSMEVEIKRDDKGLVDQKQIETLQTLKKSYEEAKKTANFKKTLQMAAAAAFAAAAIMAGVNYLSQTAAQKACTAGLIASAGECTAAAAAAAATVGGAPIAAADTAGATGANATATQNETQAAIELAQGPSATMGAQAVASDTAQKAALTSATASCSLNASAAATCAAGTALKLFTRGICMVPPVASLDGILGKPLYANINYTPKNQPSIVSEFFQNIFVSEAHADIFSPMGIIASAAIAYLLMTSATLGLKLDTMLFSPAKRAIIWAVFGGLAFMATTATNDQIKKIEANIAKIDELLKSLNALQNGVATNNTPNPNISGSGINKVNAIATTLKPGDQTISQSIGNNKIDSSDKPQDIDLNANGTKGNLPCVTGNDPANCQNFSSKLNAQTDLSGLPDYVQAQIGGIGKLTDSLNGKSRISADSLDLARNVAGQQNALKNILKKQQTELQKALNDNGSKINLAQESDALTASLQAVMKKELDARKTSAAGMYASIAGSSQGGGSANSASDDKKTKGFQQDFGSGFAMPSMPSIPSVELKRDNAAPADDAALAGISKKPTATMDDYDLKNDITQDKGKSIFDLISIRYQKSMERLFSRKK